MKGNLPPVGTLTAIENSYKKFQCSRHSRQSFWLFSVEMGPFPCEWSQCLIKWQQCQGERRPPQASLSYPTDACLAPFCIQSVIYEPSFFIYICSPLKMWKIPLAVITQWEESVAVIESPLPFITAANSVRRGAWARARGMSDSLSERYLLPSRIVLSMVIAAGLRSCANSVLLRSYCQFRWCNLKAELQTDT